MGELRAWFRTDADRLEYLEWLRWPSGFACPDCGHGRGWRLGRGRFTHCGYGDRTSVAVGTIFNRTRAPSTVWFVACWLFASGKDGMSALSLKRTPEIAAHHRVRGPWCIASGLGDAPRRFGARSPQAWPIPRRRIRRCRRFRGSGWLKESLCAQPS
ncbi:MAG: transposase [Planctomycetes bacterium]|nr:transposase [Planctomycetota bacterium]